MSMKKAAKRSQRILAESSSSNHKEVEQEEENGQEQELVDQLYKLYYKKSSIHVYIFLYLSAVLTNISVCVLV